MTDILRRPATEVMGDHSACHKVLQAICLDKGYSYVDSYERFARGVQTAGSDTVYSVVQAMGLNPGRLAEDIRTLERADEEKQRLKRYQFRD